MIHTAKSERVWVHSMGKRFLVRAIATSDAEANSFMQKHSETALIACFGPFNIIANQYCGLANDQEVLDIDMHLEAGR